MIRVILSDPLVSIGRNDVYLSIMRLLQGFFDRVSQRLPASDRIQVLFPPGGFQAGDRDIIVYFTPTDFSVVARLTKESIDPLTQPHWGLTKSEQPTAGGAVGAAPLKRASEVYPRMIDAEVLARLAFHEAMHNKLRLGNEMHTQGGMASKSVGAETPLTDANIAAMAAAMRSPVPQWPEGFEVLRQARIRRDNNDPMWYK